MGICTFSLPLPFHSLLFFLLIWEEEEGKGFFFLFFIRPLFFTHHMWEGQSRPISPPSLAGVLNCHCCRFVKIKITKTPNYDSINSVSALRYMFFLSYLVKTTLEYIPCKSRDVATPLLRPLFSASSLPYVRMPPQTQEMRRAERKRHVPFSTHILCTFFSDRRRGESNTFFAHIRKFLSISNIPFVNF